MELFTVSRIDGGYRVETALPGIFDLYWSKAPQGFTDDNLLCSFEGSAEIADPCPGDRCYFHIMQGSWYCGAALRSLEVSGVKNARELGYYETADGKAFVRPGVFFRTGQLSSLDESGIGFFEKCGLRMTFDLRSDGEAEGTEDPEMQGVLREHCSAMPALASPSSVALTTLTTEGFLLSPKELLQAEFRSVEQSYPELPFDNEAYRRLFGRIKEGYVPCVFHCAAGKDRTGLAAVMLLIMLGVSQEEAIADYLLTNDFRRNEFDAAVENHMHKAEDKETFLAACRYLYTVNEKNMRAALKNITDRFGSFEAFFEKDLGITARDIAAMREKYLVPHEVR